jgi:predicted ATP-grasp superfamily ATP-dependent carboligase
VRVLIVEDGTQRGALAAVRSLGTAGHRVGVASPSRGYAARSRWCRSWHEIPAPVPPTTSFADAITSCASANGYEIAFGVGDAEALALSQHRDTLGCSLGYPQHDVVVRAFDKALISDMAVEAGIAVPRRFEGEDGDIVFPVIVKETLHGPETATAASMRVFATVAHNESELAAAVATIEERGGEAMIEERVAGDLEAIFLYALDGVVWASGRQVAERLYPAGAGVSCRAVTAPMDRELMNKVEELVRTLGWSGVAELQFLRPPDGIPRLIDLNGRFYGSLALAVEAGVDLPVLWVEGIQGRPPTARIEARPGVRYQWLEGDLRRAWAAGGTRGSELKSAVAASASSTHSIWRLRDPWPAVHHAGVLMSRGPSKAVRWTSRRSSTTR